MIGYKAGAVLALVFSSLAALAQTPPPEPKVLRYAIRVAESGFDAVSSIGLTEHIGRSNYPSYFSFLYNKLRPEGRLLNHTITRPHDDWVSHFRRSFINRYVFPDGELSGDMIITELDDLLRRVQQRRRSLERSGRMDGMLEQARELLDRAPVTAAPPRAEPAAPKPAVVAEAPRPAPECGPSSRVGM